MLKLENFGLAERLVNQYKEEQRKSTIEYWDRYGGVTAKGQYQPDEVVKAAIPGLTAHFLAKSKITAESLRKLDVEVS